MVIAAWLPAGVLALLLFALFCPVRYRLEAETSRGFFEVSAFFGLYRKRIAWPVKKETAKAEAGADIVRVPAETPTVLSEDGRSKEERKSVSESKKEMPAPSKESADAETGETKTRPSALAVFRFAWGNGTVRLALAALGKLLRHASPGTFLVTGRAGLSNPADTGIAAGLCAACLPGSCRIEWDYTQSVRDLKAKAAGRIVPVYVLGTLAGLMLERPARETIRFMRGGRRN